MRCRASESIARVSGGLVALGLVLAAGACRQPGPAPSSKPAQAASPGASRPGLPREPAGPPGADVAAAVDRVIAGAHHPQLRWPDIPDVAPVLKALYDAEPDRLFWFAGAEPYPVLAATVAGLSLASEHGLDRADYDAQTLASSWARILGGDAPPVQRTLFDVALTASVARLVAAVHVGRVDPATLSWGYDIEPKQLDRARVLRELRDGGDLKHALALLEPPFAHYARARRTLARYEAALAAGEPPPVPDLPRGRRKLEPGAAWAGLAPLAARLVAFGDLHRAPARAEPAATEPAGRAADAALADAAAQTAPADGGAPGTGEAHEPVYDASLVDAVKRFQGRHGLEVDGMIGAGTIAALNGSLAHRVRQIQLAMERMRWLPRISDEPTVFVNVALFRLWATDPGHGDEPLRMNVVVGKALNHQTPIFVDRMQYVVFRPYWNPPYDITVKEIVPHARRDPGYFARENLEIVASGVEGATPLPQTPENLGKLVAGTLFVRQKPGPKNSLGLAKFIFPNSESIYMHGTPAQQLFSRARRDFSHGCIRVEDPARLAMFVLRDRPEWTRERILEAMQGERPTRVDLKQPLTVVLFYDTFHVNSEGVAFFVEDIYGHDRRLDAALAQGYPYPTKR